MTRKQLVALFVCGLFPWISGNGLAPLLPVYVRTLGASPAGSGAYLAFSYLGLAIGALSAGWISARFQRKTPLLVASFLAAPTSLWIGRANSLVELTLATVCLWFLGGIGLAMMGSIGWFGGILGFALGGVLIQNFGAASTLLGAAGLFIVASFLLICVRGERKESHAISSR